LLNIRFELTPNPSLKKKGDLGGVFMGKNGFFSGEQIN
jgi:hypothetical protein